MTNYDGRSYYATLGKDPVTPKEPLSWTYHKSCEKLYQLHRERVTFVDSKVDDRMVTYDFMSDTSFKEKAKQFHELRLMKENEIIYGRICKVEGQESRISKDAREHAARVQIVRETDYRLRSMGRKRIQDKIERENVYFHQRINKVQPFYSRKKMSDDYKHHELFKRGRKSMPCAGHLLKCDKVTAPKRLAPVLSISGPLSPQPSMFSQTRGYSIQGSVVGGGSQLSQFPSVSSYTEPFLLPVPKQLSPIRSRSQGGSTASKKNKTAHELPKQLSHFSSFQSEDGDGDAFDSFAMPSEIARAEMSQSAAQFEETHLKLYSKSIPLPLETNQCSIRVYASVMYDEHLYLRCCALSDPNVVLASRQMTLDQAFDIVKTIKKEEHSAADFHNIRDKLSKMFEEADKEHRGYLTYAEFETLMSKIDIGISTQELRFVIQEADENQNGFVDYVEFIPLAVDMILAFHSRTRAIESQNQLEVSVDDEVLHQLSKSNIDAAATQALEKIRAADSRNSGTIRPAELRRILKSIASKDAASGLSDNEITMVIQTLARDPFGKIIYSNFAETLRIVCFNSLKNMIIQSQGSDLQNYLTELFKTEEARLLLEQGESEPTSFSGLLPFRTIISLMSGSVRLSLSRLQVMVIASSAEVEDGNVNYYKFAPAASKTIELMFQPHILRQRAELIETTELSPTHLLNGATPEEFLRKLRTLFSSYDLGKTGQLNPRQFRAIMDSMDLQLTPGEIMALMSSADTDNSGGIDFDEFAEFCMTNLLHLEREKHIRLLQDAMNGGETGDSEETHRLESHLLNIFQLADHDNSGNLSYDELEVVFQSVNIHMSQFQLQVLLSEMDVNNDGSVSYEEFIPAAADLLQAYRAKSHAVEEKKRREEWASQKATEAEHDWIVDVRKSVSFLYDKLTLIADTIEDVASKRNAVLEVLRHPNSGLNRTESNMLLAKLYPRQENIDDDTSSLNSSHTKGSITVHDHKVNDHHQNVMLNLENLISEIRKMTIMRGFLEALPASSIAEHLMHLFESESTRLETEKHHVKNSRSNTEIENVDSIAPAALLLPLSSVFSVLEKNTQVRLNRTQILGILSWSDCYEQGNSSEINCKRFAVYAADVIAKLNNPEQMLKRATVVKNAKMDAQTVLNGATQAEVDDYYFTTFSAISHEKDFLEERDILKVFRGVPKVNLSDRECLALSAAIPLHPDIGYDWRQFLPSAYLATAEICRERLIARRITLMGASEMNAEDRLALQRVAEGVANLVTLRRSRGKLYIVLPTDTMQGRKSSLLNVKNAQERDAIAEIESFDEDYEGIDEAVQISGSNSFNRRVARQESNGVDSEENLDNLGDLRSDKSGVVKGRNKAYSRTFHQAAPDSYDILRMGKRMPVITISVPGEAVDAPMNRYLGEGAADKVKGEWVYLLVKFMENDPLLCPDATPLKIIATTLDCSHKFDIPVTLRLPSIGAVDGDAAKQFARNIMEKLYLEKYKGVFHLRIYDKKEVVISNEPERSKATNNKAITRR